MLPRARNVVVLAAVALAFGLVTLVRYSVDDVGDGYTLLYVLPVALAALQFGLGGGLAAATVAVILVTVWAHTEDAGYAAADYLTRALVFFVLGSLVGYETQELRRLHDDRERLLASLEAMARSDVLTGLPNRRAWEEALEQEIERASRDGLPLVVAMLDLDFFKQFNDQHGHPAGDDLLKEATALGMPSFGASTRWPATAARRSPC